MLFFAVMGFRKKNRHLLLPLLVFFIIGNVVLLQPWDFDNHKWMMGCYFILTIFGVVGIGRLWESRQENILRIVLKRALIVLLILIILFPSFLGLYHYWSHKQRFSSWNDIKIGESIMDIVPQNEVILTSTGYNHPVFLHSARPVFEGYRGWIWTHGLDMDARDKETKAMFESNDKNEACRLFKKNNIRYVFISDWERKENLYRVNESFFVNNFEIVYNENNNLLFKIEC